LFPAKALSKVYRAKYVALLRQKGITDKVLIETLFAKNWVVYAKLPFGGPQQVIEYLGRYTHKIAISNHRLLQVDESSTTFSYKDYKSNGCKKGMTLSNAEFIRRFAMHILPLRFLGPFSSVIYNAGLCPPAEYCLCVGTKQALLQGWLLCVGFVCLANVPELVRWLLMTSPIVFKSWCNYWLYVSYNLFFQ
jgi:hypothetical protein